MILLHVWSHISQQGWALVSSQACKSLEPCKSPCGNRWIPASTRSTIPEQQGHSWDQNNPRQSNASRRGGQLSICRLDHSVSRFKNAAFLGEEIFPVSFSHHCRPAIIWQWEWATFLEQPQFASLGFSLLANGKQVARTLHVQWISGLIGVSVLSHTDLVVLLTTLLI